MNKRVSGEFGVKSFPLSGIIVFSNPLKLCCFEPTITRVQLFPIKNEIIPFDPPPLLESWRLEGFRKLTKSCLNSPE